MWGSAAAAGKGSMRLLCGRQLAQALAAQERLSAVAGFSGRTAVLQQLQPRRHASTGKRGGLRPVQAWLACHWQPFATRKLLLLVPAHRVTFWSQQGCSPLADPMFFLSRCAVLTKSLLAGRHGAALCCASWRSSGRSGARRRRKRARRQACTKLLA